MAWHVSALVWLLAVSGFGALAIFRAVMHSSISDLFEIRDVPALDFLDTNYSQLYWLVAGLGAFIIAFFWQACRMWGSVSVQRTSLSSKLLGPYEWNPRKLISVACPIVFVTASLLASWPPSDGETASVNPTGWLDWISVAAVICTTIMLGRLICGTSEVDDSDHVALESTKHPAFRYGIIYLLCALAVFVYAIWEHKDFWDPATNGDYEYKRFFAGEDEISQANLVLYSTSILFASIAGWLGCAGRVAIRTILPGQCDQSGLRAVISLGESRRLSWLLASLWAFLLGVPWQIKVLAEIKAENGWILPALVLSTMLAGLVPLMLVSILMWKIDFATALADEEEHAADPEPTDAIEDSLAQAAPQTTYYPRRSEFAFWTLLLFPLYPYLRLFRWGPTWTLGGAMMVLSAAIVSIGIERINSFEQWFDFDDWRGMMKAGQIPVMLVFFSMMASFFVYLVLQRLAEGAALKLGSRIQRFGSQLAFAARGTVVLCVVAVMGLATWPFWGWNNVNQNVFARLYEFSDRYEFELNFLHWVFDADRDGYAAVLNGADPDDFDSGQQAGGLPAREIVAVPQEEFEVADKAKAEKCPSVLIFYLEGVVPRAISAYGQRELVATPHMDSVARDGVKFTNARCYYPSTWDAWFATVSGRYFHVTEMDNSQPFGNRYSRYNNLYKVMETVGCGRWCHGIYSAHYDMYVPDRLKANSTLDFLPKYDVSLTDEDEEREVWPGDRYMQRICDFLDTVEPGQRFFASEHMSDTHFPWRRTKDERAVELGFPDGLAKYEADALTPSGKKYDIYDRYYQTITRTDGQIGKVIKKLKERGLYDETMIVIVSDHGCQWWEHEHLYYVSHLYEQSLHIPLIIKAPGVKLNASCDTPVMHADILPTIMDVAGVRCINEPATDPLPGHSMMPLMRGERSADVVDKFVKRDVPLMTHYDTIGLIHHFKEKLIFDRPSGTMFLFDLENDPGEMTNLVDTCPELVQEMLGRLRTYLEPRKYFLGQIKRDETKRDE